MLGLRPYTKDNDIFSAMDDMERSFFGIPTENRGKSGIRACRTDIRDLGDKYLLEAELPGFKKEEINMELNGDILTLSAEHSEDKEEKKGTYVTRERRYGSYSRCFDVSEINKDGITADYKDGVLTLELPKLEKTQPETRKIELK